VNREVVSTLVAQARFGPKETATSRAGVVVSSHPVVTRVGTDVLRDGGNATDAVLAAALAQTVVEPHMSTISGMLSALVYDAASGDVAYVNGAGAAPMTPLGGLTRADLTSGKGVAVPGFWAAWEALYERQGSLPRSRLTGPAVALARDGFEVYPFLWGLIFEQATSAGRYAEGRELFFPDGRMIDVGDVLRQPQLATTIEALSDEGSDYFYRGAWAERFVKTVQGAGGVITAEDMAAYEARWMEPARSTFRDCEVVASPPPDNGGTHVIEILNLVEQIPVQQWGPASESPETLYWLTRFCGEVFADGARQGDPAETFVPLDLITSKRYAEQRFQLMRMRDTAPPGPVAAPYPGSNHLTVTDRHGNVVTALHSVMSMPWTNGLHVDGVQVWAGAAHFLRRMPKPGGRATCYVAPNLLLRNGRPVLASGSPGIGLLQNIVQNTLNIVDFGIDIKSSVHRPRFGSGSLDTFLTGAPAYMMEADLGEKLIDAVKRRGLAVEVCNPRNYNLGSFEGIFFGDDGLAQACADPRRSGAAEGV
jgi:gamma-glutamyltranspeptidase / glutathione hydrolase